MYRVILIDDEPLILAGIASLICWEDHNCCIVGKATNGHTAIDLILETKPDIWSLLKHAKRKTASSLLFS